LPRQKNSWSIAACLLSILLAGCANTHLETARQHLFSGQESEARHALELEITDHPDNLDARYNLAVLLERAGHEGKAADLYRENLEHHRHLPSVVNLSAWLRRQGQIDEARQLLQQATKDYRSEAVPYYLLAEISQQDGKLDQAASQYRKAIKADKKNGYAHLRYARLLADTGHIDEAVAQANKAVRLLPRCASCLNIAGDILSRAGKDSLALALWQRSIAIAPDAGLRAKIQQAIQASR
jgi:Tfp pilus assembly protein PilF